MNGRARIPRRQTQGIGSDFKLAFGIGARGGDNGFEARLFFGQLVEVGIFFGIGRIYRFELGLGLHDFTHAGFDLFAYGLGGVEFGFLRQITDLHTGQMLDFAVKFLVGTGHDAQYGGLAGAVQAEQADLGAGEEGQGNVLDDLALGRDDFAHAEHGHYILSHDLNLLRVAEVADGAQAYLTRHKAGF